MNEKLTENQVLLLTAEIKGNVVRSLTTVAEYLKTANAEDARELRSHGYVIPTTYTRPEVNPVTMFSVGFESVDGHGKITWVRKSNLQTMVEEVKSRCGKISAEGGYVSDDGIVKLVGLKAHIEGNKPVELPLCNALETPMMKAVRWYAAQARVAKLQAELNAATTESQELGAELDVLMRDGKLTYKQLDAAQKEVR